jgi:hypothetical protein
MITFALYLVIYLCIGLLVAVVTQVAGANRWFCPFDYEADAALNMLLWPMLLLIVLCAVIAIVIGRVVMLLGKGVVYLGKRMGSDRPKSGGYTNG